VQQHAVRTKKRLLTQLSGRNTAWDSTVGRLIGSVRAVNAATEDYDRVLTHGVVKQRCRADHPTFEVPIVNG